VQKNGKKEAKIKIKIFMKNSKCTYIFLKALTVLRGPLAYPNGLLDLYIETFGRTPCPGISPT
jgi:hypothetical protein